MANTAAKGYVALRNFEMNGEQKTAGTVIMGLSSDDAAPFLAVGVIAEVPDDSGVAEDEPAGPQDTSAATNRVFGQVDEEESLD